MNAIGSRTAKVFRTHAFQSTGWRSGLTALAVFSLTSVVSAATNTWSNGTTGNWADAGSWSAGGVPVANSTDTSLSFTNTTSSNATATDNLGAIELNALSISGSGSKGFTGTFTSGSSLNFVTSSLGALPTLTFSRSGAGTTTFAVPITVTNTLTISNTGVSGLGVSSAITDNGGILVTGTVGFTLNGEITGSAGVTYDSSGTIARTTAGVNTTYAGATTISGGTVSVERLANGGSNSAIGKSASDASNLVLDGGVLQFLNNIAGSTTQSTNRNYTLTTNGGGLDASGSNSGTITFSGDMTASGSSGSQTFTLKGSGIGTSGAAGVLSGTINNGSGSNVTNLTKTGTGIWTLSGANANTFTGLTTVSSGELDLNKTSALGSGGGAITGDVSIAGGTLKLLASDQIVDTSSVTVSSGTLNFNGQNETLKNLTNSGGAVNYGTGTISITDPTWSGGSNTVSGKTTFGQLTVSNGTNTVTGTNSGGAGVLTVGGATDSVTGDTDLTFSGTASPAITLNSDAATAGKLVLAGNVTDNVTAGTASIASGGSAANSGQLDLGGSTRTFTVADGSADTDMSVSATVINGGLTKAGAGTLALSNSNTYAGGTSVNAGTLLITNSSNSATGSGALSVGPNATLAGNGGSSGTSFNISGSDTSNRAQVLVGQMSSNDTNTLNTLTMIGSGASTIANANLTFNLSVTTPGALGSNPAGSGNELNVGNTAITFGAGVQSTTLTLNLQGGGIIAANTPYVLLAGTGSTTFGATTSGQYAGLSTFVNALGQNQILNSGDGGSGNLILDLSGLSQTYYGANSYLFIYQSAGVDDIEVEVVPEPGTWALMLGGLALLLCYQKRRKQRLS